MREYLRPLTKNSVVRTFSSGSTILYQGEVPRSVCILTSGLVRVFSISPEGEEQIVTHHVAGEFFPSSWVFGKTPSSLFFYEAVNECKVSFVSRSEFMQFVMSDTSRMRALLDYLSTSYTASLIRINALEQSKARDKLLHTLYYLCQRYGRSGSNKVTIQLALTHHSLAALVGVTRETTATEMVKLKKQGVLTYKQQRYTIDKKKLLGLIGEDSFYDVDIS